MAAYSLTICGLNADTIVPAKLVKVPVTVIVRPPAALRAVPPKRFRTTLVPWERVVKQRLP